MDQMAVETTLKADVKDKGRATVVEENSTCVREERIQNEDQVRFPAETAPGESSRGGDNTQPRESDITSSSLLSLKMHRRISSSAASCTTDDLSSSRQSNMGVDCADVVLNCLFCRFYNMIVMLPCSCETLTDHCCPNYKHVGAAKEVESTSSDDDDTSTAMDCGLLGSCHDASDCLELAMEVSEICYQ